MKRFVSIICLYVLAILLITLPYEFYDIFTYHDNENFAGQEVMTAVKVSKTTTRKKIKKLILGDSTGHALYPCEMEYDSIVSLACNQAITFAGQYFLLRNYLETNKNNLPSEVILLVTPESLSNDVDFYAYQYFLKPFPIIEYHNYYTNHLYARIKSIPLYWSANFPFIQTSNYTPEKAVPKDTPKKSCSTLTYEYLTLIDSITKKNNISFCMLSTPVREDRRQYIDSLTQNIRLLVPEQFSYLMETYSKSITYYPSNLFYDNVHMKNAYVPKNYLGVKHSRF